MNIHLREWNVQPFFVEGFVDVLIHTEKYRPVVFAIDPCSHNEINRAISQLGDSNKYFRVLMNSFVVVGQLLEDSFGFINIMEGYKNGYQNLVIGITETFPGGAPPMHTHKGEESHVLLEGEILYALGDTIFTITAPYIINIPPMFPHAFKNIGEKTANLVVIFPTNVWEYDVLDYFPFKDQKNE